MSGYAIFAVPVFMGVGLFFTIHRMFKTRNIATSIWTRKCDSCGDVERVVVLDEDYAKAIKALRVLEETHKCSGGEE